MSGNIPANPTYDVYISQLMRISRICDTFQSFVIKQLNRDFGTVNCVHFSRSLSEDIMHCLASMVLV